MHNSPTPYFARPGGAPSPHTRSARPGLHVRAVKLAGGLTSRQREVATLIARGLTNRQIATELVITEGTVALHVKHVLRGLGFTCRAQIAAWVVQEELLHTPPASWSDTGRRFRLTPRTESEWTRSKETDSRRRLLTSGVPAPAELTEAEWATIAALLPPPPASGRHRADDRRTVNGILWVLGTSARWRALPPRFGSASTCHRRLQRWRRQGVWDRVWHVLQEMRGLSSDSVISARPPMPLHGRRMRRALYRGRLIRWQQRGGG